jgi:hypothetical protein
MSLNDTVKQLEEVFLQKYERAKESNWQQYNVKTAHWAYESYRGYIRNLDALDIHVQSNYKKITDLWLSDILPKYKCCDKK